MKVFCKKCGDELNSNGGLYFGPPIKDRSEKIHLCVVCCLDVENFIINNQTKIAKLRDESKRYSENNPRMFVTPNRFHVVDSEMY